MKTIDGEIWKVSGSMGTAHAHFFTIEEFYIPKHHISFNIVSGCLNVFYTGSRYTMPQETPPLKIRDIKIPEKLVKLLVNYLKIKNKAGEEVTKFIEKEAI